MPEQPSNRLVAENNNNYSLYRLKKDDLKNVCDYYSISNTGRKIDMIKRIVEYRDENVLQEGNTIYTMPLIDLTFSQIKNILNRFHFHYVPIFNYIGYWSNIKEYKNIFESKKNVIPKLDLAVMYSKLEMTLNYNRIDRNTYKWPENPHIPIRRCYEENTKMGLISKINNIFRTIEQNVMEWRSEHSTNTPPPPPQQRERERQNVQVKNLTNRDIHLYYGYKRQDGYNNYIQCNYLMVIEPGVTKGVTYVDDNTILYSSKTLVGRKCYFMDIRDYLISENKVAEKNQHTNTLEIKMNREEIDLWKEAALKCDYLLRELKRLGIEKNDNFAAIIDLHQDIEIPQHSEREKEVAGIPSTLTNIT